MIYVTLLFKLQFVHLHFLNERFSACDDQILGTSHTASKPLGKVTKKSEFAIRLKFACRTALFLVGKKQNKQQKTPNATTKQTNQKKNPKPSQI